MHIDWVLCCLPEVLLLQYIAVEKDPKMDDIEKLMLEVWALEKPKLVITVSGCDPVESNSASNNNENLVKRIREGLIKAVKSTGNYAIFPCLIIFLSTV